MGSSVEKVLYRKAALIFEEMGFLLPRAETSEIGEHDGCNASVSFHGPFSGRLVVSLSSAILAMLSANMLGVPGPVNASYQQDALGEIANVICGNLLPEISDRKAVFHLDAPVLSEGYNPHDIGSGSTPAAQAHFGLDVGCADVALFITA